MRNLNTNSGCSSLAAGATVNIDNLTDEQFSDMLKESNDKANSLNDFFYSLDSRISALYDDKTDSEVLVEKEVL